MKPLKMGSSDPLRYIRYNFKTMPNGFLMFNIVQFDHSFDMVQPKDKWAINRRCVHHVPQVVLKRINGAKCKHTEKCTFWKPYPCTMCHK